MIRKIILLVNILIATLVFSGCDEDNSEEKEKGSVTVKMEAVS